MDDMAQRQVFWRMAFSDKVTDCEFAFAAWRQAITVCQDARKTLERSPDSLTARFAYDGAEQTRESTEQGYREARKELEAWVCYHPFPV